MTSAVTANYAFHVAPSAFVSNIKDVYEIPDGMGLAVFENKYSRVKHFEKDDSGTLRPVFQTWGERAQDVVEGNFSLDPRFQELVDRENFFEELHGGFQNQIVGINAVLAHSEFKETLKLSLQGVMAYAGRHLQHGDRKQRHKLGELFTNCSTAMFSFIEFFLLLKGSGVGRDYSSDMCWVDWDYMPECRFVLDGPNQWNVGGHPDYQPWIESLASARHKYDSEGEKVRWFEVEDSAEGWVKVLMILETAAFHKNNKDSLFVFDFSKIRASGTPIRGQQDRPASGPVPLIEALMKVMSIKGAGFKPWKQALFIDDYISSVVALGGIRRCLPEFYSVNTTDGWKNIKEVVPLVDKVVLPEGTFLIKDLIDNGVQQTVAVQTSEGPHVCTPEHRWLAYDELSKSVTWVEAQDLKTHHRLLRPKCQSV